MRIGIPGGILTIPQVKKIAEIAQKYGRGLADVTTRQAIQLHWLTIEALPVVVEELQAVGLAPKGACGDVVRNVTGCPVAGINADEISHDSSELAREVAEELTGNPEFYNLPRKFKISITGCPVWCSYPEINDVGLTAVERFVDGKREVGYSLRVGGGLSAEPHLAVRLNVFLKHSQVMTAVRGVVQIFKEQESLRQDRKKARLKYLFMTEGWTAESFLKELENKTGHTYEPAAEEKVPDDVYRDHVGVHAQKQAGLSYVGVSVVRGRLKAEQLMKAAELAECYGDHGAMRTTVNQNIILTNIRNENVQALLTDLAAIDLQVEASMFWRGGVACTGTEFCKLAITETKGFLRWLVDELEERMPDFREPLRLNVTGCPNGCGQHWIADIGLEGKKVKHKGELADAYNFNLGGAVGVHHHVARVTGYRCMAEDVPAAIERLLREYLKGRKSDENLRAYLERFDVVALKAQLAGEAAAV